MNEIHLLKKDINKRFPESINFSKSGKYVTVYSQCTNPCEYDISTLKDFELRNEELVKSFANLNYRTLQTSPEV